MSEWTTYTVQELIEKSMLEKPLDGNHGSIHPKGSDFVSSGIPFIMANDLKNGSVDYSNCSFIREEQAKTLRKGFSKAGDVLLTHKATMGRTAIVDDTYSYIVLTPQVTYYRTKDGISNKYLKYYFDSKYFQGILSSWSGSGSTRSYLGITAQRKLPIILPPLPTQRRIVAILSSLDDKIENNRKTAEKLEEIAQTIFKRWFVDFEFPNKDGKPYKSSGGNLIYCDELGKEIPDGWKSSPIGGIVEVTDYVANGSFASLKQNVEYTDKVNGYAILIRLVDFNRDYIEPYVWVGENGYNFLKKSSLNGGETIISNVGANSGTVFKAPYLNQKMTLGPNSIMLKPNQYSGYLHCYLTSYQGKEKLLSIRSGSAQPKFNKTAFRGIDIAIPTDEILYRFNDLYKSLSSKVGNIEIANREIRKTRDALLPKLMSGEIEL